MARRFLKQTALLRMINDHMATLDDCRDFEAISLTHAPGHRNSANWAISGFYYRGTGEQVHCTEAIEAFVTELQRHYDMMAG